jgi:hypothetical protein
VAPQIIIFGLYLLGLVSIGRHTRKSVGECLTQIESTLHFIADAAICQSTLPVKTYPASNLGGELRGGTLRGKGQELNTPARRVVEGMRGNIEIVRFVTCCSDGHCLWSW